MVASRDHAILLRGLGLHEAGDARPTIVRRSEIKFLDRLLADMRAGGSFAALADATINRGRAGQARRVTAKQLGRERLTTLSRAPRAEPEPIKLYQPVHRTFQFAVLEAVCDLFPELGAAGQPRLDRNQIESAGLVVRRINAETGEPEAWLSDGGALRGWVPLGQGDLSEQMDPDPQRRPRRLGTGVAEIDAQLGLGLRPAETLSEAVEPLYTAPPEVCAGAEKTLLFGMIPTVSLEHSETSDSALPPPPRLEIEKLRALFADYLTPAGGTRNVPLRLNPLGLDYYQARLLQDNQGDKFLSLLRWAIELDALDNSSLIADLNAVSVTLAIDPTTAGLSIASPFERVIVRDAFGRLLVDEIRVRLGDFVARAAATLRDSEADLTNLVTVPSGHGLAWHIPNATIGDAALNALADRMQSRIVEYKLVSGERRFDPRRGRYVARAFIRVRRDAGCPPQLYWSEYSEVFQIAQHWDHNPDVPPTVVPLPGVPSRDALKSLTPNVAFEVPESLQNFLDANGLSDFLEGSASKGGGGIGILWICSFSIQIIMMIAFVILIIFAILLNIVFNWLIFIRICLPIPVPTEE